MITINCTTAKEATIVNHFIETGMRNAGREYLEEVLNIIGDKLNLTFTIEENKVKKQTICNKFRNKGGLIC